MGVPEARREERTKILNRMFDLFKGHDTVDEIRWLKDQDERF